MKNHFHDTGHWMPNPDLALPRKSEYQKRGVASTIFNDFGMSRNGIKPADSNAWAIGAGQTLFI